MPSGAAGSHAGFLTISWAGQDADHSGANSAPQPARSPRHPPLHQCSSLAVGEAGTLHETLSGEWCCLVVRRGSREQMAIPQHPSASAELLERIQLRMPLKLFHGHQSSPKLCPNSNTDRPMTCQQATPLGACPATGPSRSKSNYFDLLAPSPESRVPSPESRVPSPES